MSTWGSHIANALEQLGAGGSCTGWHRPREPEDPELYTLLRFSYLKLGTTEKALPAFCVMVNLPSRNNQIIYK